jgi:ABC-type lipoprotein release transport system permease subunit
MRTLLFTAFRNLYYHSKRYLFIFIAIASAVSLSILINGVAFGALESIKDKAARYFAGHVSISGYAPEGLLGGESYARIAQAIGNSALPIRTIGTRTQYNRTDASLFFSGKRVMQRKLIGVDFAVKGQEFSTLPFQEGSWESLLEQSTPGILMSSKAASILGCRVGDAVTLYLTTDTGQYNTADLIVAGIFQETSLFGYAAYLRKADLNAFMLRPMDSATDIALYVERNVDTERIARNVAQSMTSGKTGGMDV